MSKRSKKGNTFQSRRGTFRGRGSTVLTRGGTLSARGINIARGGTVSSRRGTISSRGGTISSRGGTISSRGAKIFAGGDKSASRESSSSARGNTISTQGGTSSVRGISTARGGTISSREAKILPGGDKSSFLRGSARGGKIFRRGKKIGFRGKRIPFEGNEIRRRSNYAVNDLRDTRGTMSHDSEKDIRDLRFQDDKYLKIIKIENLEKRDSGKHFDELYGKHERTSYYSERTYSPKTSYSHSRSKSPHASRSYNHSRSRSRSPSYRRRSRSRSYSPSRRSRSYSPRRRSRSKSRSPRRRSRSKSRSPRRRSRSRSRSPRRRSRSLSHSPRRRARSRSLSPRRRSRSRSRSPAHKFYRTDRPQYHRSESGKMTSGNKQKFSDSSKEKSQMKKKVETSVGREILHDKTKKGEVSSHSSNKAIEAVEKEMMQGNGQKILGARNKGKVVQTEGQRNEISTRIGRQQPNIQKSSLSEKNTVVKQNPSILAVKDLPIFSDDDLALKKSGPSLQQKKEDRFFFQTSTGQDLRTQLLERALIEKRKLGLENPGSSTMTSALEALRCYSPETHSPPAQHNRGVSEKIDTTSRGNQDSTNFLMSDFSPMQVDLKQKEDKSLNLSHFKQSPANIENNKGHSEVEEIAIPGLGFDDIDDIDKFLYGNKNDFSREDSVVQKDIPRDGSEWSDDETDYLPPRHLALGMRDENRTPSPVRIKNTDRMQNTQSLEETLNNFLTSNKSLSQNMTKSSSSNDVTIDLKLSEKWKSLKEITDSLTQKGVLKEPSSTHYLDKDTFVERKKEDQYYSSAKSDKNVNKYTEHTPESNAFWESNSSLIESSFKRSLQSEREPDEKFHSLSHKALSLEDENSLHSKLLDSCQSKKIDHSACEIPLPSFQYKEKKHPQETNLQTEYQSWKEKLSGNDGPLNEVIHLKEKLSREDSTDDNLRSRDPYSKKVSDLSGKHFILEERSKTEQSLKRTQPMKDSVECRLGLWNEKLLDDSYSRREKRQHENIEPHHEESYKSTSTVGKKPRSPFDDSLEKRKHSVYRKSPERTSSYRDEPRRLSPGEFAERWRESPRHISLDRLRSSYKDYDVASRSPDRSYNRRSRRDSLEKREEIPVWELLEEKVDSLKDYVNRRNPSPRRVSWRSPEWSSSENGDRSSRSHSPEKMDRISGRICDERWKDSPEWDSHMKEDKLERRIHKESPSGRSPFMECERSHQRDDFRESPREFSDNLYQHGRNEIKEIQSNLTTDVSKCYQPVQQANYYTTAESSPNTHTTATTDSHYYQQQQSNYQQDSSSRLDIQQSPVQQPTIHPSIQQSPVQLPSIHGASYPFIPPNYTSTHPSVTPNVSMPNMYGAPEAFIPFGIPPPSFPLPPFNPPGYPPVHALQDQKQFPVSRTNLKVIPLQENLPQTSEPTHEQKNSSLNSAHSENIQQKKDRVELLSAENSTSLISEKFKLILNETNERKKQFEILRKELERLRKMQGDLMRKKQKEKDGHKDSLILESNKLQEEVINQMRELQKKIESAEKILKKSRLAGMSSDMKSNPTTSEIEEEVPKSDTKKTEDCEILISYFDPGSHWCKQCNEIFPNLYKVLGHMHESKHKQNVDPFDRPWWTDTSSKQSDKKSKDKTKKASLPLKGVQFIMPTSAYYCTLCKTCLVDSACAEEHLKSVDHNNNYKKFITVNPVYERRWKLDKAAGLSVIEKEEQKRLRDAEKHDNKRRRKDSEKKQETVNVESKSSKKMKVETSSEYTSNKKSDTSKSPSIKLSLAGEKDKVGNQRSADKNKQTKPVQLVYIGKAPNFRSMLANKQETKTSGKFGKFSWKTENVEKFEDNSNKTSNTVTTTTTSINVKPDSDKVPVKTAASVEKLSKSASNQKKIPTPNVSTFPLRKKQKPLVPYGPEPMLSVGSETTSSKDDQNGCLPSKVDIARAFAGKFTSKEEGEDLNSSVSKNKTNSVPSNNVTRSVESIAVINKPVNTGDKTATSSLGKPYPLMQSVKKPDTSQSSPVNKIPPEALIPSTDKTLPSSQADRNFYQPPPSTESKKDCPSSEFFSSGKNDSNNSKITNTFDQAVESFPLDLISVPTVPPVSQVLSSNKGPPSSPLSTSDKKGKSKTETKIEYKTKNYFLLNVFKPPPPPTPLTEEEKDLLMLGIDKRDMQPIAVPKPPPLLLRKQVTDSKTKPFHDEENENSSSSLTSLDETCETYSNTVKVNDKVIHHKNYGNILETTNSDKAENKSSQVLSGSTTNIKDTQVIISLNKVKEPELVSTGFSTETGEISSALGNDSRLVCPVEASQAFENASCINDTVIHSPVEKKKKTMLACNETVSSLNSLPVQTVENSVQQCISDLIIASTNEKNIQESEATHQEVKDLELKNSADIHSSASEKKDQGSTLSDAGKVAHDAVTSESDKILSIAKSSVPGSSELLMGNHMQSNITKPPESGSLTTDAIFISSDQALECNIAGNLLENSDAVSSDETADYNVETDTDSNTSFSELSEYNIVNDSTLTFSTEKSFNKEQSVISGSAQSVRCSSRNEVSGLLSHDNPVIDNKETVVAQVLVDKKENKAAADLNLVINNLIENEQNNNVTRSTAKEVSESDVETDADVTLPLDTSEIMEYSDMDSLPRSQNISSNAKCVEKDEMDIERDKCINLDNDHSEISNCVEDLISNTLYIDNKDTMDSMTRLLNMSSNAKCVEKDEIDIEEDKCNNLGNNDSEILNCVEGLISKTLYIDNKDTTLFVPSDVTREECSYDENGIMVRIDNQINMSLSTETVDNVDCSSDVFSLSTPKIEEGVKDKCGEDFTVEQTSEASNNAPTTSEQASEFLPNANNTEVEECGKVEEEKYIKEDEEIDSLERREMYEVESKMLTDENLPAEIDPTNGKPASTIGSPSNVRLTECDTPTLSVKLIENKQFEDISVSDMQSLDTKAYSPKTDSCMLVTDVEMESIVASEDAPTTSEQAHEFLSNAKDTEVEECGNVEEDKYIKEDKEIDRTERRELYEVESMMSTHENLPAESDPTNGKPASTIGSPSNVRVTECDTPTLSVKLLENKQFEDISVSDMQSPDTKAYSPKTDSCMPATAVEIESIVTSEDAPTTSEQAHEFLSNTKDTGVEECGNVEEDKYIKEEEEIDSLERREMSEVEAESDPTNGKPASTIGSPSNVRETERDTPSLSVKVLENKQFEDISVSDMQSPDTKAYSLKTDSCMPAIAVEIESIVEHNTSTSAIERNTLINDDPSEQSSSENTTTLINLNVDESGNLQIFSNTTELSSEKNVECGDVEENKCKNVAVADYLSYKDGHESELDEKYENKALNLLDQSCEGDVANESKINLNLSSTVSEVKCDTSELSNELHENNVLISEGLTDSNSTTHKVVCAIDVQMCTEDADKVNLAEPSSSVNNSPVHSIECGVEEENIHSKTFSAELFSTDSGSSANPLALHVDASGINNEQYQVSEHDVADEDKIIPTLNTSDVSEKKCDTLESLSYLCQSNVSEVVALPNDATCPETSMCISTETNVVNLVEHNSNATSFSINNTESNVKEDTHIHEPLLINNDSLASSFTVVQADSSSIASNEVNDITIEKEECKSVLEDECMDTEEDKGVLESIVAGEDVPTTSEQANEFLSNDNNMKVEECGILIDGSKTLSHSDGHINNSKINSALHLCSENKIPTATESSSEASEVTYDTSNIYCDKKVFTNEFATESSTRLACSSSEMDAFPHSNSCQLAEVMTHEDTNNVTIISEQNAIELNFQSESQVCNEDNKISCNDIVVLSPLSANTDDNLDSSCIKNDESILDPSVNNPVEKSFDHCIKIGISAPEAVEQDREKITDICSLTENESENSSKMITYVTPKEHCGIDSQISSSSSIGPNQTGALMTEEFYSNIAGTSNSSIDSSIKETIALSVSSSDSGGRTLWVEGDKNLKDVFATVYELLERSSHLVLNYDNNLETTTHTLLPVLSSSEKETIRRSLSTADQSDEVIKHFVEKISELASQVQLPPSVDRELATTSKNLNATENNGPSEETTTLEQPSELMEEPLEKRNNDGIHMSQDSPLDVDSTTCVGNDASVETDECESGN